MIEQDLAEKEKDELRFKEDLNTVQEEKYRLKKQLVEIIEAERKAEFNLSKVRSEIRILTRAFWQNKNG